MHEDYPDREPEVSAEVEVTESSLRAKLNLPANLTSAIGRNFVKAVSFAAAGIAPERYLRTKNTLSKGKIQDAIADKICAEITDPAAREAVTRSLTLSVLETESRLQRRGEIIASARSELPYFADQATAGEEQIISDEFLSHYWDVADRISNARMREIFAQILAKEVASPGGFSASTMNLLSTLHPDLAQKFDLLCSMTFSFEGMDFVIISVPHAQNPNTTGNSVGWASNIMGQQLSEFGLPREELLELRSAGLIRSMPEEEYPNLTRFYEAPQVDFAGVKVRFKIRPGAPAESGASAPDATNVVSLTRTGSEIRRILKPTPHSDYKARIREVMTTGRISMKDCSVL